MKFISTRGGSQPVSFSQAVACGLAPDGGLYLPDQWPDIRPLLPNWEWLGYADLCEEFFALFSDLPREDLSRIVRKAYARFDSPQIAPMVELDKSTYVLELFHGPTLAFKDFALQLLGGLYEEQIRRSGRSITVLGATSGDTGAAAIHGLLGREGVNIFILYPDGRVSPLQERQMTCTGADNVYPLAIEGTFDDAQAALKDVFGDAAFKERVGLSAVNSINIARILAQCVYYIHAWLQLPNEVRDRVEFVVPTGNFGNVLAGWMARHMGLPVKSFRVATNQNDILYRFFKTGRYELAPVHPSHAPSMDIQVASNFERFIYFALGESAEKTCACMDAFKRDGRFELEDFDPDCFRVSRADDAAIVRLIAQVKEKYDYLVDPHTACAFAELDTERVSVILSTAHPAKFPDVIAGAVGSEATHSALEMLKSRPIVKYPLKAQREAIESFIEQHLNQPGLSS